MNAWAIHNDTLTTELVDEGFVSIGWDDLGDLRQVQNGRDGIKRALERRDPDAKPRSVAGQAGVIVRFRDEITPGDVVVAPYKPDSTINIGIVSGDYEYAASEEIHRHRRPVEWKKVGVSRTVFSQAALYELGGLLTLFRLRKHADEFVAVLDTARESVDEVAEVVDQVADEQADDESADEPRASRIERHTRDFVLDALHRELTHRDFEEFTAALLRSVGYQARVTQFSQDGGVDVIAHHDPLGIEPPQIKVQCKHRTGTTGSAEVQQLAGTQGEGEYSLFVTLGNYSKDALAIERQRPGLRLLAGEDIVTLTLDNYAKLPESWRSKIPLTSVLVVADTAGS